MNLFTSPVLREIETLDPGRDHQRIVFLSCRVDFPWDTTRALEFALFRTFGVPAVSALLHKTKEFELRAQKRYDDTDIIVSEIMEHGYDSERGRAAIARMNDIHGRFQIRNQDFLYVLSTFVLEPIRWNERFGWRRMLEKERVALFHFWRAVGERMNLRDIPASLPELERFSNDYEREHYRHTEANHRVGAATRELFKSWFPRWTRPLVERGIHAFMDDTLIEAFGFPKPSPALRRTVQMALKLRGHALRLWPRRRQPLLRTKMKHRSYPCGYAMETIGPDSAAAGCPFHAPKKPE
jgi:hypothetical protein